MLTNFRFLQRMKCKYFCGVFAIIFLLTLSIGSSGEITPTYVIKRDFFTFFKAHGFSIYDGTEKNLLYRIESKFAFSQTIEMIDQKSNETIGKLNSVFLTFLYKANISIIDPKTNQWVDGNIRRLFTFVFDTYVIEWNGQKLLMEKTWNPMELQFRHQTETGPVVAKIHQRWFTAFSKTYDLEIFSNDLPAPVYILALAAHDYESAKKSSSSSSSSSRKVKIH